MRRREQMGGDMRQFQMRLERAAPPERKNPMEKKQLAGALCLLMAAAATAALAHPDSRLRGELVMSQPPPKAQEELRAYFNQHYQEATCSAVYVDLNHDGTQELLVMELEADQKGQPVLLHDGPVDPERFTAGTVTVLGVGETGAEAWMEYPCSAEEPGGLYLVQRDGHAYLLGYTPSDSAAGFDAELFFLNDAGEPVVLQREQYSGTSGGDETAELLPLLEQGSVVWAFGTAPDGQSRFVCLDELFTTFED